MKNEVIRQAFKTSIPVMAGYIVLGMGFGLLLHDAGYGVGWALLMAVTIYAGTMQYVGVSLLAGAASVLTTALTTLMVQARHLFYSISMIERYKGAGKYKPYMIFGLTDETYSLLSDDNLPVDPKDAHRYRFLVTLFNHSYWIIGCVTGNLLGEVLPFSTRGLEFSMTALLIIWKKQWRAHSVQHRCLPRRTVKSWHISGSTILWQMMLTPTQMWHWGAVLKRRVSLMSSGR